MKKFKGLLVVVGPALALGLAWVLIVAGLPHAASWTAAVTFLCALWWVFEPIPIPATSLLPFALFPVIGVLDHKTVAVAYGNQIILLLLGGFMLSKALERSGAHRRLALYMVKLVGGGSGRRLVFGFMIASSVLSMWISNTATTLMLLPVVQAIIDESRSDDLTIPLLLGIAYSASLGGVGTPIGTPPNVIFISVYQEILGGDIGFTDWMRIGIPEVVLGIPLIGLWLTRRLHGKTDVRIPRSGAWRAEEVRVLALFSVTALAWITRKAPFGGWTGALELPGVGDSTVALLAVCAMFVTPNGKGERLLDWKSASDIPWGLLILFGGGIAIARAFMASGLSQTLGQLLSNLAQWPPLLLIGGICLAVTFLTEVTSNTATTTLLMPVLATAGKAARIDPLMLMIPATISASCAFMLPVATAPNAIVFGTGKVTIEQMAREGFALNLIIAVVTTLVCYFLLS